MLKDSIIEVKKQGGSSLFLLYRIKNEEFLRKESEEILTKIEIDKQKLFKLEESSRKEKNTSDILIDKTISLVEEKNNYSQSELQFDLEGYVLILYSIICTVNYRFPGNFMKNGLFPC